MAEPRGGRTRTPGGRGMRVRWGILSTARINEKILAGAQEAGNAEVVAVAGRDRARTEEYARAHGIPRAHTGYDAVLADPDVEAVYISLPNGLHAEWSIRALNAGKHVLCEKPLGRRAADVEAAFDAADRNGRLLAEAFMYRHHPQTAALVEAVAGGAVGELLVVRSVYVYNLLRSQGDDWTDVRLDPGLDGGALQDLGCYCVSAARLLAGEPERVYGVQRLGKTGVDVLFAGTLEFAGGAVAQFECSFAADARVELEVLGTMGRLVVREPFRIEHPGIERWDASGLAEIACEGANAYRLELEDMSSAIRDGGAPLLGRADALGQALVLESLFESAATGAPVAPAALARVS